MSSKFELQDGNLLVSGTDASEKEGIQVLLGCVKCQQNFPSPNDLISHVKAGNCKSPVPTPDQAESKPKRGPGRPRKYPVGEEPYRLDVGNKEAQKRGRKRKEQGQDDEWKPLPSLEPSGGSSGRVTRVSTGSMQRKNIVDLIDNAAARRDSNIVGTMIAATSSPKSLDENGQPIKRGRGRPRKVIVPDETLLSSVRVAGLERQTDDMATSSVLAAASAVLDMPDEGLGLSSAGHLVDHTDQPDETVSRLHSDVLDTTESSHSTGTPGGNVEEIGVLASANPVRQPSGCHLIPQSCLVTGNNSESGQTGIALAHDTTVSQTREAIEVSKSEANQQAKIQEDDLIKSEDCSDMASALIVLHNPAQTEGMELDVAHRKVAGLTATDAADKDPGDTKASSPIPGTRANQGTLQAPSYDGNTDIAASKVIVVSPIYEDYFENDMEEEDEDWEDSGDAGNMSQDEAVPARTRNPAQQKGAASRPFLYPNRRRTKRNYKCPRCTQRFFYTHDELELHLSCHVPPKEDNGEKTLYRCFNCDYEANIWNRILDHMAVHDEIRQKFKNSHMFKNILGEHKCGICGKLFERKINMKTHIANVHTPKPTRVCPVCGETLINSDTKGFRRHVEKCQGTVHQCQYCPYKTKVSANFRKHVGIHLGKGFSCDTCSHIFPTKQRLKAHVEIHNLNRRKFMCENCGQEFTSQDAVQKHVVRVHTNLENSFSCTMCKFTAKLEHDLKKHINVVHNKKFKCEQCPFQSNSKVAITQHAEFHRPDRQFPCPWENCYYRGPSARHLNGHINQRHRCHSKHQCPICHKYYKKKTHLARHLVSHTGDKPYACLECGDVFSTHSTYYRHRNKTGHDARRDGVTSVPSNITIQYIAPDSDFQLVEDTPGLPGEMEAQEAVEEIMDTTQGDNRKIVMLEGKNGEKWTYVVEMDGNENGTDIGEEELAHLLQQQFNNDQQIATTNQEQAMTSSGCDPAHSQAVIMKEVDVADDQAQGVRCDTPLEEVVTLELDSLEGKYMQVQGANGVVRYIPADKAVEYQSQQESPVESVPLEVHTTDGVQVVAQQMDATTEITGHLVEGAENMAIQALVQAAQGADYQEAAPQQINSMQFVDHVVYEDPEDNYETIVEVNPEESGLDTGVEGQPEYRIIMLPESEPEAALGMLQLQAGNLQQL